MVRVKETPRISVIMGSKSDFPTMSSAVAILEELSINHEVMVISAHRTPERLYDFAKSAHTRGIQVVIAGAGGAAHLPGMVASLTHLPVIGVPIAGKCLDGMDSLLSISQMPRGTPVATMAIGTPGASNAAIMAASILSLFDADIERRLRAWKQNLSSSVPLSPA